METDPQGGGLGTPEGYVPSILNSKGNGQVDTSMSEGGPVAQPGTGPERPREPSRGPTTSDVAPL
jgi:hypothetical protein